MKFGMDQIRKIGKERFFLLVLFGILAVIFGNQNLGKWSLTKSTVQNKGEKSATKIETEMKSQDGDENLMEQELETDALATEDGLFQNMSMEQSEQYYERQIEAFLEKLDGAGAVKVLLSLENSKEYVLARNAPYQKKEQSQQREGENSTCTEVTDESEVIFYETRDGNKLPFIVKKYAPSVKGIVVLAQGGDKASVVREITGLLQALFGIDSHKIKVAKLRQ